MILILYVGTRRLAGILAEPLSGNIRVTRFREIQAAEGFQRGEVAQMEKAVASIGELLKLLELGEEALEIPTYVLLSGPHLKMTRFSSSIYYTGYPRVVTSHEIRQVVEQTRNIAPLPLEDWILQGNPESFWVNDLTGVQDPTGLEAQRLAVTLQIYTTNYASFRNLSRVLETFEFNLKGYFPKTFFIPEGILNAAEREGESLVIDLSDDATHLVLTREGKIDQTRSLDVGSRFLTSRIAETWQLNWRDAERLKERFGSLEANSQVGEELIPLVERNGHENHPIRRSEFHQTFLGFGEELFGRIGKEAENILSQGKAGAPRFVLTGGGAKLEGLLDFFGRRLNAPVRLGTPRQVEAPPEFLMDPAWAGPVGLLRWLTEKGRDETRSFAKGNFFGRAFLQAKEWLAAYF